MLQVYSCPSKRRNVEMEKSKGENASYLTDLLCLPANIINPLPPKGGAIPCIYPFPNFTLTMCVVKLSSNNNTFYLEYFHELPYEMLYKNKVSLLLVLIHHVCS